MPPAHADPAALGDLSRRIRAVHQASMLDLETIIRLLAGGLGGQWNDARYRNFVERLIRDLHQLGGALDRLTKFAVDADHLRALLEDYLHGHLAAPGPLGRSGTMAPSSSSKPVMLPLSAADVIFRDPTSSGRHEKGAESWSQDELRALARLVPSVRSQFVEPGLVARLPAGSREEACYRLFFDGNPIHLLHRQGAFHVTAGDALVRACLDAGVAPTVILDDSLPATRDIHVAGERREGFVR